MTGLANHAAQQRKSEVSSMLAQGQAVSFLSQKITATAGRCGLSVTDARKNLKALRRPAGQTIRTVNYILVDVNSWSQQEEYSCAAAASR